MTTLRGVTWDPDVCGRKEAATPRRDSNFLVAFAFRSSRETVKSCLFPHQRLMSDSSKNWEEGRPVAE